MRHLGIIVVPLLAGLLAGCVGGPTPGPSLASNDAAPAAVPADYRADFEMPWQLTPASAASEAQGERTSVVDVPGVGPVKGTDTAIQYIGKQMVGYPGSHRVVAPCYRAVNAKVRSLGATSVEAAAAGPEERLSRRAVQQQVLFRIMYTHADGSHEVRQSSLECQMNAKGHVFGANPV